MFSFFKRKPKPKPKFRYTDYLVVKEGFYGGLHFDVERYNDSGMYMGHIRDGKGSSLAYYWMEESELEKAEKP